MHSDSLIGQFLKLRGMKRPIAILVGKKGGKKTHIEELIYQDDHNTCGVFWTTYLKPIFAIDSNISGQKDLCELRVKEKTAKKSPSKDCTEAFEDICIEKKKEIDKRE